MKSGESQIFFSIWFPIWVLEGLMYSNAYRKSYLLTILFHSVEFLFSQNAQLLLNGPQWIFLGFENQNKFVCSVNKV